MTRTYTPRARAETQARTRARIVDAARRLLPSGVDVPVDEIARNAGTSVQTLYTHFGSKRGLLLAVIDAEQRDAGMYVDFSDVWVSPDGETALRRMLEVTIRLWDRAWNFVAFTERARRTDAEVGRVLAEVDGYRLSDLRPIMERLEIEGRLRPPFGATAAADVAFALSVPAVFAELVRVRSWTLERATEAITNAVVSATINTAVPPLIDPPADWSGVVQPHDVLPGIEPPRD